MGIECEIVHAIPGRLRLRVPILKQRRELAEPLRSFLRGHEGVTAVEMTPVCGSVTIWCNGIPSPQNAFVASLAGTSEDLLALQPKNPAPGPQQAPSSDGLFELVLSCAGLAITLFAESIAPVVVPVLLVVSATPILARAFKSFAREERLTVDVLDASAVALLVVQRQMPTALGMIWLLNLGDYIRSATAMRAREGLDEILSYRKRTTWVVRDGEKVRCQVQDVIIGDTIVVYPGDLIPVDGRVVNGKALVDEHILTGESLPSDKEEGSQVYAGTVVHEGQLYIETQNVGDLTEAAKIVHLIDDVSGQDTRMQNHTEQWANELVPYSFLAAGFRGVWGGLSGAAAILIIDYGTGIRVAAPTAVLATKARALRQGILIKGGRYLEQLAEADAVVFDKTGTLTRGAPTITHVESFDETSPQEVLTLAAACELRLSHPLAHAIVHAAELQHLTIPSRSQWSYAIGLGAEAVIDERPVRVGRMQYLHDNEIDITETAAQQVERLQAKGLSIVCVARDGRLIGVLGYSDPIREEARDVIAALYEHGVEEIVLLTGDHVNVAREVAQTLGIRRYIAEALPSDKVGMVKQLQQQGRRVAFVGDGINDSPALAHADVGIAVGGGAAVAEEAAHVVLLNGDLSKLPEALMIGASSMNLMQETWRIISVPNTIALALALGGAVGPGVATVLSNGAAIFGVGNALRPLWQQPLNGRCDSLTSRSPSREMPLQNDSCLFVHSGLHPKMNGHWVAVPSGPARLHARAPQTR